MTGAVYSPGSWVLVAGPCTWLFADVDPAEPIVSRCWELVRVGADVELILGAVADEGLRLVPSFVTVQYADDRCRVVVRGAARVQSTDDTGVTSELSAGNTAVWQDRTLDQRPAELRLARDAAAETVRLPLADGVVLASSVTISTGRPAERPRAPATTHDKAAALAAPEQVAPSFEQVAPSSQPAGMPEEVPAAARFDHLFGPSRLWAAEVPPAADEHADEWAASPPEPRQVGGATLLQLCDEDAEDPPAVIPERHSSTPWQVDESGIIQAIGFGGGQPAMAPPVGAVPIATNDLPEEALVTRLRSAGQGIEAVRCEHGHLNPPTATACRACGMDIPPQEPAMIARPHLGVLRLMTGGEPIALDRAVILGRAPDPAAGTGPGRAHAIKIDSPGMEISRSHVEFRADGGQLLVTDLGSANGTIVTQPNSPPTRLDKRGSVVVRPGAVVTLADEVSFRYEVAP